MNKFVAFVQAKPSLSLVLLSAILTGFSITPSFASLLMHLINLGLLSGIWTTAKQPGTGTPVALGFISVGLTSVMMHPSEMSAVLVMANIIILIGAIGMASKET